LKTTRLVNEPIFPFERDVTKFKRFDLTKHITIQKLRLELSRIGL